MAILATLNREKLGEWRLLADFLRDVRRRETSALGALSAALSAPADEQRELAQGEGASVLLEAARDLRVPKGARLAAARCLLEATPPDAELALLFAGAGDLATDPRLGATARKLVESGLPAALAAAGDLARVSLAAGAFARAVQAGASAVGPARVREILARAPAEHAGATAARFALGDRELPPDQLAAWRKLLAETCSAHRKAPAPARRVGLAPEWPPNVPEAFAPLLLEAEKAAGAVAPADAVAERTPAKPPPIAPPISGPPSRGTTEFVGQKTLAPPIRRSPFRRSIGTVVEVPARGPSKAMDPIGRHASPGREPVGPLPGLAPLPSRDAGSVLDRDAERRPSWKAPVLPPSEPPPPMRAAVAPGPFAERVASLLDDRPEAIDRLCAAADARAAVAGEDALRDELLRELKRDRWKGARAPRGQLDKLRAIAGDAAHPATWRVVASLLLEKLCR